jgi:ABC-2 type transport system permease protein
VLAATGLTALVASLARDAEQASSWLSIVAVVLGMLGGSFFPVARAGGLLELASRLAPHSWFLEGLSDLRGGAGPSAVLQAAGAMLAFAAVTGGLALLRIGRLVER